MPMFAFHWLHSFTSSSVAECFDQAYPPHVPFAYRMPGVLPSISGLIADFGDSGAPGGMTHTSGR
jgi:hypothetical protein